MGKVEIEGQSGLLFDNDFDHWNRFGIQMSDDDDDDGGDDVDDYSMNVNLSVH